MGSPTQQTAASSSTVLDRLCQSLRAKDVALDGQARPAVILWTDPSEDWVPLLGLARTQLPELLTLGQYDPQTRSGPAIWLRSVIDGPLKAETMPEDAVPILYLPGVSRQDLRAGQECPDGLKPLVELMYRGTMWLQNNGSDWAARTYLGSNSTLNLDIAGDDATNEALLRSLSEVALQRVDQLRGQTLYADDFDKLVSGDYIRDLLRWMGDADGTQERLGANAWNAFANQCKNDLGFDPKVEPQITAGERLGTGEGGWSAVWDRFLEAPNGYLGVVELLRRSRPGGGLFANGERWPDVNDENEQEVRDALSSITNLPHSQACDEVLSLEAKHGNRRQWVWARLDQSPMAMVLEPLSRLADGAKSALNGQSPSDMASIYIDRGWKTDVAAWEAVAVSSSGDEDLINAVVKQLLEPWLEQTAINFQKAVINTPLPAKGGQAVVEADAEMCLLFADGLRYDIGQRLIERLEGRGCSVESGHRWAALPTVTATAKPAVTPVHDEIVGVSLGETFEPQLESSGKNVNAGILREQMKAKKYQVLDGQTALWPDGDPAKGWKQAGDIDTLGHKLEGRLARHINDEVDRLIEQILALLEAGWAKVRIVTDHGWLLLPGGLPKVDLPKHLTKSRWARCAVIVDGNTPDVLRLPWFWNGSASYACAPGIACFNKSEEYTHGGLSLQECLIPDIIVSKSGTKQNRIQILSVGWIGMRCHIHVDHGGANVTADLRLENTNGISVVVSSKLIDVDGTVSLVLDGDEHEDANLTLVLNDDSNTILAHRRVKVGETL